MVIEFSRQGIDKTRRKYETGTIVSDRGASYESSLGFNIQEMVGKKVLDIGSGSAGSFLEEAKKRNVNVVSISPDFRNGLQSSIPGKELKAGDNTIGARVQALPFEDSSFEFELALYSVPYYLPYDFDEYNKFVSEVIRTLKSKGKFYAYPMNGEQKTLMKQVLAPFLNSVTFQFGEEGGAFRMMLTKK